jgi:hypothetical protein
MKFVTVVCAGLLAGTAAFAQEAMTTGHLAALDANGDGGVDSAEFGTFIADSFRAVDADADGFITPAESQSVLPSEQFAATDIDSSGGISPEEFAGQAQKDFTAADLDGDGVLN